MSITALTAAAAAANAAALSNTTPAALAALSNTPAPWIAIPLFIVAGVATAFFVVKTVKEVKTPIPAPTHPPVTPPVTPPSALADTLADAVAEAAAKAGFKKASDYGVTTVTEEQLKAAAKAAALPKVQDALNSGKTNDDAKQAATPDAKKAVADIVDPAIKAVFDTIVTTATTAAVTNAGKKMTDAGIALPSNLEAAIKAAAEKAVADGLADAKPKADIESDVKAAADAKGNEIADKAIAAAADAAKNAEFVKQQRLAGNKPAADAKVAALIRRKTDADTFGRELVALGNAADADDEALGKKKMELNILITELGTAQTKQTVALEARREAARKVTANPSDTTLQTALADAKKAETDADNDVDRLVTEIDTLKGEIAALRAKVGSYPAAKQAKEQELSNNYAAQAKLVKEIANLTETTVDAVITKYGVNGEVVKPLIK